MDKAAIAKLVIIWLLEWLMRDDNKDGVPDRLEPFLKEQEGGAE